eukprot:1143655-Pelagomonas_calceolata.AAC.15
MAGVLCTIQATTSTSNTRSEHNKHWGYGCIGWGQILLLGGHLGGCTLRYGKHNKHKEREKQAHKASGRQAQHCMRDKEHIQYERRAHKAPEVATGASGDAAKRGGDFVSCTTSHDDGSMLSYVPLMAKPCWRFAGRLLRKEQHVK